MDNPTNYFSYISVLDRDFDFLLTHDNDNDDEAALRIIRVGTSPKPNQEPDYAS